MTLRVYDRTKPTAHGGAWTFARGKARWGEGDNKLKCKYPLTLYVLDVLMSSASNRLGPSGMLERAGAAALQIAQIGFTELHVYPRRVVGENSSLKESLRC